MLYQTSVRPISLQLGEPRKLPKLTHIHLLQPGTSQTPRHVSDRARKHPHGLPDITDQPLEQIRRLHERELQRKTKTIVPLQKCRRVEHATGQVCNVDAGEGVYGAGVAAYGEEFGVLRGLEKGVLREERDGVFGAAGTRVPIFWDAFVAWSAFLFLD